MTQHVWIESHTYLAPCPSQGLAHARRVHGPLKSVDVLSKPQGNDDRCLTGLHRTNAPNSGLTCLKDFDNLFGDAEPVSVNVLGTDGACLTDAQTCVHHRQESCLMRTGHQSQ